jgi:outer membrane lipoprotein-sorting protein
MLCQRLYVPIFLLLTLTSAHAGDVKTGEDVLRAMHDRYAKSWYETLTFTQKSTTYNPDGTTKVETWYEALALPGKLRIDIGTPSDGNGYLLVDGTVTVFKAGKETGTRPLVNMLLVLGFDVYRQTSEDTVKIVKAEGYDLTKLHEDTWEGHPVYVVGAEKGDLKSRQFWVEKDRLLFVRIFEPGRSDSETLQDVRFEAYRELSGGWVAARVEVYVDEKKTFSEDYSDIQSNVKLGAGAFDPKQFNSTHWEKP